LLSGAIRSRCLEASFLRLDLVEERLDHAVVAGSSRPSRLPRALR
jgi:hypothetical protein